jgi:hypothetical protein
MTSPLAQRRRGAMQRASANRFPAVPSCRHRFALSELAKFASARAALGRLRTADQRKSEPQERTFSHSSVRADFKTASQTY